MKTKIKTQNSLLAKKVLSLDDVLRKTFEREKMVSLKNTKVFLTFIQSLAWRVVILSTLCSFKSSKNRVAMIHNFARYLISQEKRRGHDYVIAYLKASQLSLSKYLAREPLGSLQEVNPKYIFPCLRNGLPKIIGPLDRKAIRRNNRKTFILWMSIFGIFRVLAGSYVLKVASITDPFSGSESFLKEKAKIIGLLTSVIFGNSTFKGILNPETGSTSLGPAKLLPLTTASPSSKISWTGLLLDVNNHIKGGTLEPLMRWIAIVGGPFKIFLPVIVDIVKETMIAKILVKESPILYYKKLIEGKWTSQRVVLQPALQPGEKHTVRSGDLDKIAYVKFLGEGEGHGNIFPVSYPNLGGYSPGLLKILWITKPSTAFELKIFGSNEYLIPERLLGNKEVILQYVVKGNYSSEEIELMKEEYLPFDGLAKNEFAEGNVGQLQFVKEAAGKLRVFAMVDCLTQTILHPLHKLLSSVLKSLPNDGTADQESSYRRARQKSIQYGCSFGYDLSSATDRLPIDLQVSIIAGLLLSCGLSPKDSKELANLWKLILVQRSYAVPLLPKGVEDPQDLQCSGVHYSVGQPMGALSSFNMLALTHHMILQMCAREIGLIKITNNSMWCDLYEITGDDVVIFNSKLASSYVKTMELLGLEINQKKSVVSLKTPAGEYLKKTWFNDFDYSQISWKQLYANSGKLMGRTSDAYYFLHKWSSLKSLKVESIVRKCVFTWPEMKNQAEERLIVPMISLLSVALRQSKLPVESLIAFLLIGRQELTTREFYSFVKTLTPKMSEVRSMLTQYFRGEEMTLPTSPSWEMRMIGLENGPFKAIKDRLVERILHIQEQVHGKHFIKIYNYLIRFHFERMLGADPIPNQEPLSDLFDWDAEEALIKKLDPDPSTENIMKGFTGYNLLKERHKLYFRVMIEHMLIYPFWETYVKAMRVHFKRWSLDNYSVYDYGHFNDNLQKLSITQLVDVLEAVTNLKVNLELGDLEPKEVRKSHLVTIRLLDTLKPKTPKHPRHKDMLRKEFWDRHYLLTTPYWRNEKKYRNNIPIEDNFGLIKSDRW